MKVSKAFNANLPIRVIQELSGHNLNCVSVFFLLKSLIYPPNHYWYFINQTRIVSKLSVAIDACEAEAAAQYNSQFLFYLLHLLLFYNFSQPLLQTFASH
jgi:hypothetical protein